MLPKGMSAEKLRKIADWVDTHDEAVESYITLLDQLAARGISVGSTPEDRVIARKVLSGTEVQDDLRAWADEIEAEET